MDVSQLPAVNASLNSLSAIFLSFGYYFICKQRVIAHRNCMIAAFVTSTIFLASYLTYHYLGGMTRFQGEGAVRVVYFTILISHTILAMVIVPLVFASLYLAWRRRFDAHRRVSRWTWPVWMYVSVTGVLIYLMLYQWFPSVP